MFVLAVFVPSLALAWLAVRSQRDQQFILEHQQSLLCQGLANRLAKDAEAHLEELQRQFSQRVETLLTNQTPTNLARSFDDLLRRDWSLASVGFAVSLDGRLLSPLPTSGPDARSFCLANGAFLANRETVEVYWNSPKGAINLSRLDSLAPVGNSAPANTLKTKSQFPMKNIQRVVTPQQLTQQAIAALAGAEPTVSKVASAEAEFSQLIGDSSEGTLARFLSNQLKVMFWYRSPRDPQLVFGAQIDLPRVIADLRPVIKLEAPVREEIAVALLDDAARPVARSHPDFAPPAWKQPFVATEIGEALPHWEVAVYLINPARLGETARTLSVTLGLIIVLLVLAISVGGWLIVNDLRRQLTLARQKTDFVSNVSHELKTPLTSIRMFSELLADGRVTDSDKQRSYLQIITAEAARLTRLINNVLDFARMDRGEKKYARTRCDLVTLVEDTVASFRPHLEQAGFQVEYIAPPEPAFVEGDRDALAQVLVNLLSNAEKYSGDRKEIRIELLRVGETPSNFEVRVLDRGSGVPQGFREKIFDQFCRAHDSLGSGISGSGLGLTLARQVACAHGGDVNYQPRDGEGSCFTLRIPAADSR